MKTAIAKWLVKYLLEFILNNTSTEDNKTITVVYYYKGIDVHSVWTGITCINEIWFRDVQSIIPIEPPENWDKWVITIQ